MSRLMPMPSGKALAGQIPSTTTVSRWVFAKYLAATVTLPRWLPTLTFCPSRDAEFLRGGWVDF